MICGCEHNIKSMDLVSDWFNLDKTRPLLSTMSFYTLHWTDLPTKAATVIYVPEEMHLTCTDRYISQARKYIQQLLN